MKKKEQQEMNKISKEKKKYFEEKYIKRYREQRNKNNWADYRNRGNSIKFVNTDVDFKYLGRKKVWKPIENKNTIELQESRGIGINEDTDIDFILENINSSMILVESDLLRIEELDQILIQLKREDSIKNFLEIGFRVPKIQEYYKKTMNCNAHGIDINNFNVELFKELNFNVHQFDLNKDRNISKSLSTKFDLICCYHVLEHVEDPEKSIQEVFNALNDEGILHIEIPIERQNPQIEYGHLIGFEPNELGSLITQLGHKIIYASNKTHAGGSWIERYTVVKGSSRD